MDASCLSLINRKSLPLGKFCLSSPLVFLLVPLCCRYKAILVQKEAYLLELTRYVVLNPVRVGMVDELKDWRWSSYPTVAHLHFEFPLLCTYDFRAYPIRELKQRGEI